MSEPIDDCDEASYESDLLRALSRICAYCGQRKDSLPPVWCVRSHDYRPATEKRQR